MAACPENDFQQNGNPCNNDKSVCYDGKCQNVDMQCVQFFGTGIYFIFIYTIHLFVQDSVYWHTAVISMSPFPAHASILSNYGQFPNISLGLNITNKQGF